ncbi:MAG: MBL fold metallo-hydrolase [Bacteroidetes bacterium]|nr:MBL fold metallo-hydrolase [Bacteroidota bacterium]
MRPDKKIQFQLFYIMLFAVSTGTVFAQQNFDDVEIQAIPVADGIYMLTGSGGNLGLSVGDEGAFLIDDQFAPLTEKILLAIKEQTDHQVQFVVNTHWHGDHTGGNESMGEAGAIIVAHENVRKQMTVDHFLAAFNSTTPASPESALPVVTFTESVTFHWNGDEIRVFHVDPAHTDGDSVIHFKRSNVIHAGDVFFNGMYPFFDTSTGGSLGGMMAATARILEHTNDETKIIPGHGALAGRMELEQYYEMLVTARDLIKEHVDAGKSRDEVIAAKPTETLDATWGGGFLPPDMWVGIVYDGMQLFSTGVGE